MPRIHAVNEDEVQNNAECLIPYSILYEVTFIFYNYQKFYIYAQNYGIVDPLFHIKL